MAPGAFLPFPSLSSPSSGSPCVANSQTRIRIRFADRSQLEGVFPSTDKLIHLYEFVRLALREDVRESGWYLCTFYPCTSSLFFSFSFFPTFSDARLVET